MFRRLLTVSSAVTTLTLTVSAQNNGIDVVTPLAPELASYGTHNIGVRTIQVTDRNRIDMRSSMAKRCATRPPKRLQRRFRW